jgi:transcriptional regulator with XRE-family HTH domain
MDRAFGEELRRLRCARRMSVRDLAEVTHHSKSNLSDWETGRKPPPSASIAAALDTHLAGGGRLKALQAASEAIARQERLRRESERLCGQLAAVGAGDAVDRVGSEAARLAVSYLSSPGAALIEELTVARRAAMGQLRARKLLSTFQMHSLAAEVGYLSGVMSYAALDDGHPEHALAHADAAWEAADLAGSDQLRAWTRGTQSLILRFGQRFGEALDYAQDGLRYAGTGTARARLLAGVGQSSANLGDARAARRALSDAEVAFDEQRGRDEVEGVFTFSRAKLLYYSGSALIWLSGDEDAERARTQAHAAIGLWMHAGPERSVADEALAHVYAATASLQLRDLESAAVELVPILSMPEEGRVSWIGKRMDRIVGMLVEPPYAGDPLAADLLEQIRSY